MLAAARACLANRSVWLMGNSVTRQLAFTLQRVLQGEQAMPRQSTPISTWREKLACGSGGMWRGRRPKGPGVDGGGAADRERAGNATSDCFGVCECAFDRVHSPPGAGARVNFGWVYDWADPTIEQTLIHGSPSSANPPPDIVIYNVGGIPIDACAACKETGLSAAKAGAPKFAAMVRRVLHARPALRFYWRSTTYLCDAKHTSWSKEVAETNAAVERHLCTSRARKQQGHSSNLLGHTEEEQAPRTISLLDAFSWTRDTCFAYDDFIHHSQLSFHHVLAFLGAECGLKDAHSRSMT